MKKYVCCVSGEVIPAARVEFLKESGIPESEWTIVKHSQIKRKQGIYTGESGTSDLLIVDKVYSDSVTSILGSSEEETDEETPTPSD